MMTLPEAFNNRPINEDFNDIKRKNRYIEEHCKYHGLEVKKRQLEAMDLWVNFMEPGDFNPIHTHGGDYSFVLFLDVPKQLKKEQEKFEGPSTPPGTLLFEFTQQAKPRYATTGTAVTPNTGDFIMFPAMYNIGWHLLNQNAQE